METTYTALDGARVTFVESETLLRGTVTSHLTFRIGDHVQEFGGGDHNHGERHAREVLGVPILDEEYTFQGGELLVGWTEVIDPADSSVILGVARIGVWRTPRYSVKATIYHGTSQDLIDLLDRFSFSEGDFGPVVATSDPGIEVDTLSPVSLTREIPGVAWVDVQPLAPQMSQRLPTWQGTLTTGGELFVEGANSTHEHYILIGETTITRIYPQEASSRDALAATLTTLSVSWN